jgi:hypothetical protein
MATQQDNREAVKALFAAALEENAADHSSLLKERCADASVTPRWNGYLPNMTGEPSSLWSFLKA